MAGFNRARILSPPVTPDDKAARRFLAVRLPGEEVAIFDPWIEGARVFGGPSTSRYARIATCRGWPTGARENVAPLIGEPLELVISGEGEGVRDLEHVARAPLCQRSVFGSRPDVAESLLAAGPAIRAVVVNALIGGVKSDDGAVHAKIGDAEIAVDPTTTAWSIENADGRRRSGRNLRRLGLALGAVSDGVFAVRLLEAVFRWHIPPEAALAIADAVDECAPVPKEVRP